MVVTIGFYSYLLIKSCTGLGDVAYPLDDSKGQRSISICTDYGEDQTRQVWAHEVLHACLHAHNHSFKTKEELDKHLSVILEQSEEALVSHLAYCIVPVLANQEINNYLGIGTPMKVIVLGTLGDLVKKIVELEALEREPSRENTVQMTAYGKILEQWPIEEHDRHTLDTLITSFRVNVFKYKEVEAEFEKFSKEKNTHRLYSDEWVLYMAGYKDVAFRYCHHKQELRKLMVELNSIGKHIGTAPSVLEFSHEETAPV